MKCVLQVGKNHTSYPLGYYYVEGEGGPTSKINSATVYDLSEHFIQALLRDNHEIWNVITITDPQDCISQTPYFDCYEESRRLNYV